MAKKRKFFTIDPGDDDELKDVVARSNAESPSHWLRGIIRSLAKSQGEYRTEDVSPSAPKGGK